MPGWLPNGLGERVYLYRLPPDEQPVDERLRGWVSAGALVSVTPRAPALVAVKLQSDGGPLTVSVTGPALDGWLTIRPGADDVAPGESVVVDLRFEPAEEGVEASGTLEVEGAGPFRLFAVADHGGPGIWGLSESGYDLVADRWPRAKWRPCCTRRASGPPLLSLRPLAACRVGGPCGFEARPVVDPRGSRVGARRQGVPTGCAVAHSFAGGSRTSEEATTDGKEHHRVPDDALRRVTPSSDDAPGRPVLHLGDAADATAAVAQLVDDLQAGWDRHDAEISNRTFAADILWGSPFGATVQGYRRLHAIHRRLKEQGRGGPRSRFEVVHVVAPTPDVVVAQVKRVALDDDGRPAEVTDDVTKPFSEMALYLLVRRDGSWWLAAGQNTPMRPAPSGARSPEPGARSPEPGARSPEQALLLAGGT